MLPAFVLVRVLDIKLEKRAEPLVDGTHTLLSVESPDVGLFTRIQFPYPPVPNGRRNGTLNTSALDRTTSQTQGGFTLHIALTLCIL